MCVDVRRLHRDCGRIKDRSWSGEGEGFVWAVACVLVLYLAGRRFSDCRWIVGGLRIAVGFWIGIQQSCRNGTTDGPPGLALFYIWRAVGSPIATDCTRISELC